MMDTIAAKLSKLAEEASEVAKEAIKQMHFGKDTEWDGQKQKDRLRGEILDFMLITRILQTLGEIDPITEADVQAHFEGKKAKIRKYTFVSYDLNKIDTPWIPEQI